MSLESFGFAEVSVDVGVDFDAGWFAGALEGPRDSDMGGGMVASDLTGDGWVDLLFTAAWGGNALYLNDGDGTFTRSEGSAFDTVGETVAASAVDLDGDDLKEVVLLTWRAVRLFWNQGGGDFVEGSPLDLAAPGERPSFVSWTDFDGDGFVDAYIGRSMVCFWASSTPCRAQDRVLRGLPGGQFEDVTERFGDPIHREGVAMAGAWEDFDGDGDLDFFLANDVGGWHTQNRVFDNPTSDDPGGAHAEVSASLGLDFGMDSMGTVVADLTTGGGLDVLVADVGEIEVFEREGDGLYQRRVFHGSTDLLPSGSPFPAAWAVEAADLDSDGDLEVIAAWHWLYPLEWWDAGLDPAQLVAEAYPLKNTIYESGEFGYYPLVDPMPDQPDSWFWHTVSPTDLNRDGAVDLVFASMMGPVSIQQGSCVAGNHSLVVSLDQPDHPGNGDALGARVEITTAAGTQWRRIGVGSSGCLSAREPEAHFGLGAETSAALRVVWPDGRSSELGTVSADQQVTVTRQPEP